MFFIRKTEKYFCFLQKMPVVNKDGKTRKVESSSVSVKLEGYSFVKVRRIKSRHLSNNLAKFFHINSG